MIWRVFFGYSTEMKCENSMGMAEVRMLVARIRNYLRLESLDGAREPLSEIEK